MSLEGQRVEKEDVIYVYGNNTVVVEAKPGAPLFMTPRGDEYARAIEYEYTVDQNGKVHLGRIVGYLPA